MTVLDACAAVTETNTIQWADGDRANCRRWIWCGSPCKSYTMG